MHDWLSSPGNGSSKVSASEAPQATAKGIPALVCQKNPGGIGYIAVVRPEQGEPNNLRIAQAGAKNFANALKSKGFGDREVNHFIYQGQTYGYIKITLVNL